MHLHCTLIARVALDFCAEITLLNNSATGLPIACVLFLLPA